MAAEGTEIPTAPAVQENANDAGAETKADVGTTNQTNGHSDSTAADQTKPAEDSESTEEAKASESAEDKSEEPKAGDKREHETSTTEPVETEQPATAVEESSEPTAKKQKTDKGGTTKAKNGTAVPKEEINGEENKKGGRGKKAKTPAAKPAVSTDGPGSRTRSRTKAAA